MHKETGSCGDYAVATLQAKANIPEGMGIDGYYHVECRDAQGNLKWIGRACCNLLGIVA